VNPAGLSSRPISPLAAEQAFHPRGKARAGGAVGRVGVPQESVIPNAQPTFYATITIAGGPAPVRAYIQELLPDAIPDGYRAMNERTSIKAMIEF